MTQIKNKANTKEFTVTLNDIKSEEFKAYTVHFDASQDVKLNDFVKSLNIYKIGQISKRNDVDYWTATVSEEIVSDLREAKESDKHFSNIKTRNDACLALIQAVERSKMRHDKRSDLRQKRDESIQFETYSTAFTSVLFRDSQFDDVTKKLSDALQSAGSVASSLQNNLQWYAEEMMMQANLKVMIEKLQLEMLALENDEKTHESLKITSDTTLEEALRIYVRMFKYTAEELTKQLTEREPWRQGYSSASWNMNAIAESSASVKFLKTLKDLIILTERFLDCR